MARKKSSGSVGKPPFAVLVVGSDSKRAGADIASGASPYAPPRYGVSVGKSDYIDMAKRDPIFYFLSFKVASDIFRDWFQVIDTKQAPGRLYSFWSSLPFVRMFGSDKKPVEPITVPRQLPFPPYDLSAFLSKAFGMARRDGKALIVFGTVKEKLDKDISNKVLEEPQSGGKLPKLPPIDIAYIDLFDSTKYEVKTEDFDKSENSIRVGLPMFYSVTDADNKVKKVHYSHAVEVDFGASELERVWDDGQAHRIGGWSLSRTLTRFGPGLPHLKIAGMTYEQVQDQVNRGRIVDPTVQGFLVTDLATEFELKGIGNVALRPREFMDELLTRVSIGSGVPVGILRSESSRVGAVEADIRRYDDFLKGEQARIDVYVRQVISFLSRGKLISEALPENYNIDWSQRLVSRRDEASATRDVALGNLMSRRAELIQRVLDALDKGEITIDQVAGTVGGKDLGGSGGELGKDTSKPPKSGQQ